MGCLFGCFRVKYENPPLAHVVSDAAPSKKRDASLSGNNLGSLFLSEERESSPSKSKGCHTLGSALLERDDELKDLRDEAKFLKACGTLVETPAEIRNASEKVKSSPTCDGDSKPSKLHSWLSSSSVKKIHWEEEPGQVSISPAKLCEDLGGELGPSENVPSRNKSVRFECEHPSDGSSRQSDAPSNHNGSKCSPYPTPLRLTDEMQTPGTIFPVSQQNHVNEKNARIRSQYVYPVLNPVENFSQWKVLKEEDGTDQHIGQPRESFEQSGHATPQCTSEMFHDEAATAGKDMKLDASLAQWLKPSSSRNDRSQNSSDGSRSIGRSSKMSDQDRPIIGMVAAHWNADEIPHVSPKWWDGNGIPNSTNKYKEDQTVSWHATPFEERLEKALSEESNVCQRKPSSGRPFIFEENEETDTAVSRLHTSAQPESVVSF